MTVTTYFMDSVHFEFGQVSAIYLKDLLAAQT